MKKKLIIGGVILCVALGFLIYTLLDSSMSYYLTVSELVDGGSARHSEEVRVSGIVVEGSLVQDDHGFQFAIADERASLPVIYSDDLPHTLTAGKEIVAKGKYGTDGIFRANKLIMKCASKYESEGSN